MDKEKVKVLEDYIKYRKLRNKSKTIGDIEHHIKLFLNSSKKKLEDFDEGILLNYLDKVSKKYSISMLNNIKSSYLKNFIKWYYSDWSSRFRNLDLMCKTERAEEHYKADDMISEDDFKKLIAGEESRYWKAYFLTLFYSCSRPTEITHLEREKIEFADDGAFITIYSKKNKREFIKFIPDDVAFYLKGIVDDKNKFVFCNSKTKEPISVKTAYARIRELSKKTLGHQIDLYTLRHSIATINYNKANLKDDDVARQMGHTKSMKNKYVHNHKERLKEIARSIYVNPEDLPPEKRHQLEQEVEALKQKFFKLSSLVEANIVGRFEEHLEKLSKLKPAELKKLREEFAERNGLE